MGCLTDSHLRTISYLRLSVTDRCNLRCLYCTPSKGFKHIDHAEILTYEELTRLTRLCLGLSITKVRLTGGEPLVRLGLVDFVRQLKSLPVPDLRLTTNGILLAENAAELYRAGVKRVNISLDTMKEDKFRMITRGGELRKVWAGLEAAVKAGMDPVKINVVAIRGFNDDEIEDFARLSLETPFVVRFIEFMPLDRNNWKPGRVVTSDEIEARLSKLGPLAPIPARAEDGPARRFKLGRGPGEVGLISPLSHHFCPTCNRLRITADGKLLTCLFSSQEIDLKKPLRSGASDGEILALLKKAVADKPERHRIDQDRPDPGHRPMGAIGG